MRRPSASVVTISTVLPECIPSTSPGLKASPPGRFSVAGTSATTSSGRPMAPTASIAPSPAAHVELHVLHARRGLYGDAPGVEGHGLAHEYNGSNPAPFTVLQYDKARFVGCRPAHRGEAGKALGLDARAVENVEVHAVPRGDLARPLRQVLGCGHVRRLVGEVT